MFSEKYASVVEEVSPHLAQWMAATQMRVMKDEKIGAKEKKSLEERATSILKQAEESGRVEVLRKSGAPMAIFLQMKPKAARVKGERILFFDFHPRNRGRVLHWVRKNVLKHGKVAPRYTRIATSEEDAKYLSCALRSAGFHVRYDILFGETNTALRNLIRAKNPPESLDHLGLKVRTLKNGRDVREALALQKRVFSKVPQHGNFSHTAMQLQRDKKEYLEAVKKGKGRILGVYKGERLLGFMAAFIHETVGSKTRSGGFTFCFDPRIQGLGIAKTGYRLLLKFLKQRKVKRFYGGTSQPAIRSLGSLMGRKTEHVLFVKASWKR